MEPSSSSKVTVQYYDPSNLFPLISPGLLSRLPLRNLHWKSPSRPLRSIGQLHVDLVPFGAANDRARSLANTSDELTRTRSSDSAHSSSGPTAAQSRAPVKERRHQIPGLRQTPYLKVYLLRCDDGDAYKSSARKLLREWIKEHTSTQRTNASSNAQDDHDAFEWLIVHVLLPNTPAAAQSRSANTGATGSGTGTDRPASSSRWPGRGTSTVLDKIRSDFNGSSKNAVDRVAQIHLHKTDIPPHLLQDSSGTGPPSSDEGVEAQQEQEAAWSDLVAKVKSLILTSFDLRVSQYEEDIREKDAQRALPGWNFCTFFVLKEGLARGFESVGLVEDALIGYDELAQGLDVIIRDQSGAGQGQDHGGAFLPFTDELRTRVQQAMAANTKASEASPREAVDSEMEERGPASLPLSANKKPYRDLILSNNISVFDFRCYLFARQMSLLLRLGNAWSSREELLSKLRQHLIPDSDRSDRSGHERTRSTSRPRPADEAEDLEMLAEVCARGSDFVTSVARVMRIELHRARNDLAAADTALAASTDDRSATSEIIDNIIASWIFSVSQQLLAETATQALPIPPSSMADTSPSNAKTVTTGASQHEPKTAIPEPKTMMHPARISSLQMAAQLPPGQPSPNVFPSSQNLADRRPFPPTSKFLKSGIEDLAAHRAELYQISRAVFAQLGERHGWLHSGPTTGLSRDDAQAEAVGRHVSPVSGLDSAVLRTALANQEDFVRLYEVLTDKVLRHYTVANRMKSTERVMFELAIFKFNIGDFATAATYFNRLLPSFADAGWDSVETSILRAYGDCLRRLDRKADHVKVLVELLTRAVAGQIRAGETHDDDDAKAKTEPVGLLDLKKYLSDLFSHARELSQRIVVKSERFFRSFRIIRMPQANEKSDGFRLGLGLQHILSQRLDLDLVKVRLVRTGAGLGRDVWLESDGGVTLMPGPAEIWVGTHMEIPGSYVIKQISMEMGNLVFLHEPTSASTTSISGSSTSSDDGSSSIGGKEICYFSHPRALEATVRLSRQLNLERRRSIAVSISTGWNDVLRGELRIRAASAGLRLRTADAEVKQGELRLGSRSSPGVLEFEQLPAEKTVEIDVPYGLENDLAEISVKVEIAYTTSRGDFIYGANASVPIALPLGVNVQDIFKQAALFSRFTVSTASEIPLRIAEAQLTGTETWRVSSGHVETAATVIFPQQPVSLLYKIERTNEIENKSGRSLALKIGYSCLDDEINDAVWSAFSSSLSESPHAAFCRLLSPIMRAQSSAGRSPEDFEHIGLTGAIQTRTFDEMGWKQVLRCLGKPEQERLEAWLQQWHREHTTIPLPANTSVTERRSIIIPVELPQVSVVHTADLELGGASKIKAPVKVGQLISATLRIKHTRIWGPVDQTANGSSNPLEFSYEILSAPEHWLVGGRRRGRFRALEGEEAAFAILLIPRQAGHLLLPTVDIQPVTQGKARAGGSEASHRQSSAPRSPSLLTSPALDGNMAGGARSPGESARGGGRRMDPTIVCETDCRTHGQSILVVPDRQKTMMTLEADEVAAGRTPMLGGEVPSAFLAG